MESPFLKINGIGPKTSDLLLKKYRTKKNILESDLNELENLIGKKKADLLIRELMKNSTGGE
jgi:excinuclease ABC subunit C